MSNKFFMVFVEGGHNPTCRHTTIESAELEAKRLAKMLNKKAYVLSTLKSFEINAFIEEDCTPQKQSALTKVKLPF